LYELYHLYSESIQACIISFLFETIHPTLLHGMNRFKVILNRINHLLG